MEGGKFPDLGSACKHSWSYSLILALFTLWSIWFFSVQFSRSVVSDSLRPHESQHARPPCPSPSPGVHSDSHPLSPWCHPAISSLVFPFFSCLQSLPASESGSFNYELHHSRKSTFLSQQMLDFQQAQQLFLLFLLRFEVGSGSIYTWPESTLFLSRQTFVRLLVSQLFFHVSISELFLFSCCAVYSMDPLIWCSIGSTVDYQNTEPVF